VPTTLLRPLFALAFLVTVATSAAAQDVQLRWIPSTSVGVAGYNVYIAPPVSGPLPVTPINVGRPAVDASGVASAWITGLNRSQLLGVEMTSYDSASRESARSNRVILLPVGESLGAPIYSASFTGLATGAHPIGFIDTGGMFRVTRLSDQNPIVSAPTSWGNSVSRYLAGGSSGWGAYEISGRMYLTTGSRIAGVAARVTSANPFTGFLLGADSRGVFSIEQRGKLPLRCASSASTGVSALTGRWYRFKFRNTRPSGRARLRAKVWREGEAEPSAWLADCWTDTPVPLDSGVFALYRDTSGTVYWDDLEVRRVTGIIAPIP
jgi:hypothetical protein